jgi:hypothetical protein
MPKLSAAIVASTLALALSAPAFAAETDTSGAGLSKSQGQDSGPTTGMSGSQSETGGPNRGQSAQMPSASPGRVQEEVEEGAKNGQVRSSGSKPALEKRDNDAGSAQSSGPASSPAR